MASFPSSFPCHFPRQRDKTHSKDLHPILFLPSAKAKKQLFETHFHQQSTASIEMGGLPKRGETEGGIDVKGVTGSSKE